MSNTVAGQTYVVVSCQSCEAELAFQKAQPSRRGASHPDELEVTCSACGHLGFYSTAHLRQSQATYPL